MLEDIADARILIVDDEPANVRLLERILERDGFTEIESTNDPRHFLAIFGAKRPDMVLLDLHMPVLDGFAVLDQLRGRIGRNDFVPILVLTADITPQAKQRALSAGAHDFLTKPVDPTEVVLRIRNLLRTRYYYQQLQGQNEMLERTVRERTWKYEEAQIETLELLARASDYRDDDTGQHAQRVGHLSALLAKEMELDADEVYLLRRAAPLHDVGKIGTPDAILLKPGRLTDEEFDVIKQHTTIGAGILAGSTFPVLQRAQEIALYHHENWDGTGYMGLEAETIPLSARIVHVVDVLDALTHERPYKKAWPIEDALQELVDLKETMFDATCVDGLLRLHEGGELDVTGAPPPAEHFRETGRPLETKKDEKTTTAGEEATAPSSEA
jgi:putative two-component system response regulator